MTTISKSKAALLYLKDISATVKRVKALEAQIDRETARGNISHAVALAATRDKAQAKIDDACERLDMVGTMESDMLKSMYVFGNSIDEVAKDANYSLTRTWELTRIGREKLFDYLPK